MNNRFAETGYRAVRLNGHFSHHAQVRTITVPRGDSTSTAHILKDYDTEVAWVVTGHDLFIKVKGLYSSTTRRHLRWFLEEFYPWRSIPMDAIKVAAGNENSYIMERGNTLEVIGETGEVLWVENACAAHENRQAVLKAEAHMKRVGTWNSFDSSDYVGRTRF